MINQKSFLKNSKSILSIIIEKQINEGREANFKIGVTEKREFNHVIIYIM